MLPNWLYGKSLRKLQEILNSGGQTAADVSYSNTESGLEATNAQTAIDEVVEGLNTKVDWNDLSEVGAVNMLPYPYSDSNKVDQGVTFIDNGDGTITVNGTATGASVSPFVFINDRVGVIPAGTYKCTVEGWSGDNAIDWWYIYNKTTREDISSPNSDTFTYNGTDVLYFRYTVKSGKTVSTTLKPMITVPSYNGDYVPYSMTNQKLTKKLTADASLSAAVDLSRYTSYSNMYTAPSDGYVHFLSAASGSAARTIYTYGNNTTAATDPHFTHSTSANNKAFEIFIKKGLMVYIDGLQSGDTINFYPLS